MHATVARPDFSARRPIQGIRPNGFLPNSGDWLAISIGLADSYNVHVIGLLPFAEILIALVLPFLLIARSPELSRPGPRRILLLMALWLCSQIIADMVNGSPVDSRLKGMARVIFFAADFVVFYLLLRKNTKRIVLLALALAVAQAINIRVYGNIFDATAWKYGGAAAVAIVITLIGSYLCMKRSYALYVLSMAILAWLNLRNGFRSQIAVDLVVIVLTLPAFQGSTRGPGTKQSNTLRILILLFFSLGAVWLSQKVVHEAVRRGYFDESLQQKFERQSSGKLGVLIGARPEIPVALRAIADAPIFGHGSYAIDRKYTRLLQKYQYELGYDESDTAMDLKDPGIPTHSHLTASWVEGGVLASFLWFYVLYLIVRAVPLVSTVKPPLSPFVALVIVTFAWDILFSPFGYDRRVYESLFLVLILNLIDSAAKPRPSAKKQKPYVKHVYRGTPSRVALPRLPRPNAVQ